MASPGKVNPYYIIFSLWLLVFAASSQVMIISPILPKIGAELNTSESLLGYLVTVYATMIGVFAIIMGPLSDKIGRRKILLIGSAGMTLALLLHSMADSFTSLLLLRAFAGMAGGVLSGSAVSYVGDYFPYEKRGWANGWIMSGIAMGQILGIPLGTFLAEFYGFKFPFILFGIIMGLTTILIFFKLPQPNVELQVSKITFKTTFKKYLELLKQRDIKAVAFSYLLMFLSLSIFLIYLPAWLTKEFGVSLSEIGWLFFAGGIVNAITGPNAGKLSDKIGRKNMIIASCIGLAIIMALTTFIVTSFWVSFILFPVAMLLIAMRISPFQALSTELVKSNNRGTLMSLLVAIGNVGSGLAGSISGPLFDYYGYLSNTIFGASTIIITAFVVWKFVPEPELRISNIEDSLEVAE
ncbi:MAG: MFS transporter [Balneolaceae bacterium]|nr:MFS transporter [Balneolaceae bacterium]MBO6546156.1 MFS transporter [Balneolaceae bacterium]MBO6648514.1 MFS transporter [Balneolaceae bacterium]